MIYQRSSELFVDAQKVIPGGVNSPVRAFKGVGGSPIFIKKGTGTYLHDEDDRVLIDLIASWGPLICGHAFPPVLTAITKALESGISFGTPTEQETLIAELVVQMVPNIEQVRFVNSGTEACMSAIRLARGYTKREKIIKFEGCYHGHADAFLINPGSGIATLGKPSCEGLTKGVVNDTLVAQYNNLESVNTILDSYPDQIAALIIEPVAGNMGCITPQKGFLEGLRKLCDKHDVLLIFDEVMTGFRISKGGAQECYGLSADIITFGKIIGGGLPVGAFAAKKEIMNLLSPNGNVYQAGTLSGNPLAMASGFALLNHLNLSPEIYTDLEAKGEYLKNGLEDVLSNSPLPFSINRCGSMISVHFSSEPVVDFKSALKGNNHIFKSVFHGMLERGVYLPPSAFESWFLNNSMSYDDLDKVIYTFEATIKSI